MNENRGKPIKTEALKEYLNGMQTSLIIQTVSFIKSSGLSHSFRECCEGEAGLQKLENWLAFLLEILWLPEDSLTDRLTGGGRILFSKDIQIFDDLLETCLFYQQLFHELFITANQKQLISTEDLAVLMEKFDTRLMHTILSGVSENFHRFERQCDRNDSRTNGLHDFINKVQGVSKIEEIIRILFECNASLYNIEDLFLAVAEEGDLKEVHAFPHRLIDDSVLESIKECHEMQMTLFLDNLGNITTFLGEDENPAGIIFALQGYMNPCGVLYMANPGRSLTCSQRDMESLSVLAKIAGRTLDNMLIATRLRQRRREFYQLKEKIRIVQENERQRIAADIHDSVAQELTAIGYRLELCRAWAEKGPEPLATELDHVARQIHQAIEVSRELIHSLRPEIVENLGLTSAVRELCETFGQEAGLSVNFIPYEDFLMDKEMETRIFRVIQEGLQNVKKHSMATFVKVNLKKSGENLVIQLYDNGIGFQTGDNSSQTCDRKRFGLMMMQETVEMVGGRLFVRSFDDCGCMIQITIPLSSHTGRIKLS